VRFLWPFLAFDKPHKAKGRARKQSPRRHQGVGEGPRFCLVGQTPKVEEVARNPMLPCSASSLDGNPLASLAGRKIDAKCVSRPHLNSPFQQDKPSSKPVRSEIQEENGPVCVACAVLPAKCPPPSDDRPTSPVQNKREKAGTTGTAGTAAATASRAKRNARPRATDSRDVSRTGPGQAGLGERSGKRVGKRNGPLARAGRGPETSGKQAAMWRVS